MRRILVIIVAVFIVLGIGGYIFLNKQNTSDNPIRIFIPKNSIPESIRDTLVSNLGNDYGTRVFKIWRYMNGNTDEAEGSYVINPKEKAWQTANKIKKGRQTPVKLTINVARTLNDIFKILSAKLELNEEQVEATLDSIVSSDPEFRSKEEYIAAFTPDTYQFYWNDAPQKVISKLIKARNNFWDESRLEKAQKLGLTPNEVTTLASIVEEESNKVDEQPTIARLYLNRLKNGMKLQADPTVKFAFGDFTLRRITSKHLSVDSPYNTYKVTGLPPGPIRLPQKSTIDAVLNAPDNNYLYMCAREDFSGYHNFAKDYATHLQNARKYTQELDRRGI